MAGSTELLVATSGVLLVGYLWCRSVFSYWKQKNLRGPKPWPIIGNVYHMAAVDRQKLDIDWAKKYGKVYGAYIGMKPQLFVADAEVMLQLCVKDFDYMPNHDNYVNKDKLKYLGNYLFNSMDDGWRRVRGLMTPTFTSSKIKRMFSLLSECSDDLLANVGEKVKESSSGVMHLKDLFNSYAMNSISTCCFALKLGRSAGTDSKSKAARDFFVECVMDCVKPNYLSLLLYFVLPQDARKYFGVYPLSDSKLEPIVNRVRKVIQHRRESPSKHDDLVQLMLEAQVVDELEVDEFDVKQNHYANLTSESLKQDQSQMAAKIDKSKGYLSDVELVANSTVMISAGLETTSTLLSVTSYCLAHHPHIQADLHRELSGLFPNTESINYEALTNCQLLDCVVSEALRCLTPVAFVERQLNRDYKLEKYNLDLPKGLKVNLSLHAIMNDPDYWPEPEKFKPERFAPENKHKIVPGSYCPFGLGPRHCIGMRFALSEAKLGIAKILLKYQLSPAPGTTFPPPAEAPVSLTILKKPHIIFEARN